MRAGLQVEQDRVKVREMAAPSSSRRPPRRGAPARDRHPPSVARALGRATSAPAESALQACGSAHPGCGCPESEKHLASRAELTAGSVPDIRHSRGRPLSVATAATARSTLGVVTDGVRVHDDAAADRAARSIGVAAFTLGEHIYFARGRYRPDEASGRALLGHELGHVRQQRRGLSRDRSVSTLRTEEHEADVAASRFGIRRQAGGSGATSSTRGVSDCTPAQTSAVAAALGQAKAWVDKALRHTWPVSPHSSTVDGLLRKYFSDDSTSTYLHVRIGLLDIQRGLRRSLSIECEQPGSFMFDWFCGDASAYVRHPALSWAIHLCPGAFVSADWLTTTIIHEISHLYGWTDDEQYCSLATGCSLSRWDAYDNADSYANYCRDLNGTLP